MESFFKAGRCFFGIGVIGIGIQQFIYRDFRPVMASVWPAWLHGFTLWSYLAGTVLILAGGLLLAGKQVKMTAILLGAFLLVLFLSSQTPFVLFISPYSPRHLGLWTDPLKELALAGGALLISQGFPHITPLEENNSLHIPFLSTCGRIFFAIMLISFGIDHFYYTQDVAGLIPAWIPWHLFWTYFAGISLIGAGVGILIKFKLRLIAFLLGSMIFLWLILLHIPRAMAYPQLAQGNEITSVFEALAFSGIGFVLASTAGKRNDP